MCHCAECGPSGALLARNEWIYHRSRESKRQTIGTLVEDGILRIPVTDCPEGAHPAHQDALRHDTVGEDSLASLSQAQKLVPGAAEPTKQWALNLFRQVEEKLAEYDNYDPSRFPLVFLVQPAQKHPPSEDSLVLNESSPLNTTALGYEKWLQDHIAVLQTLAERYEQDRQLSIRIGAIKKNLGKHMELMTRKKTLEWKRQSSAFSKAGDHLVDTRKPFMLLDLQHSVILDFFRYLYRASHLRYAPNHFPCLCVNHNPSPLIGRIVLDLPVLHHGI